jgi:hypothetical protein
VLSRALRKRPRRGPLRKPPSLASPRQRNARRMTMMNLEKRMVMRRKMKTRNPKLPAELWLK